MAYAKYNSGMKIIALHKDEVKEAWHAIKHHFEKVVADNTETSTVDGIYKRAVNGDYIVILALENDVTFMAMVCEIVTCDTGLKILMIPQLAGYEMGSWIDELVIQLHQLADRLGCEKIMISGGRKGWIKAMKPHGGKMTSVVIEFDVKEYLINQTTFAVNAESQI